MGSVAKGPYANYGNALIERSTFRVLGLPSDTPRFSIFEPIDDALLERINGFDCVVITGCTTLQDDPGHQVCFDARFEQIRIPKICFAGTFYSGLDGAPSLRVARLFDAPIGARDPWAADYLAANGIDCELVGCPTVLDQPDRDDWVVRPEGEILVAAGLDVESVPPRARPIAHDARETGDDIRRFDLFDEAAMVMTNRLHAALPAIARGIPVRFFDPGLRGAGDHGDNRFTLLQFLGIPLDGGRPAAYPAAEVRALKAGCSAWLDRVIGAPAPLLSEA